MFDKEKAAKITLFASLGVMSLVLLITSSIWMNLTDGLTGFPVGDKAATSVSFVVFGIVALSIAGFITSKEGIGKKVLLALAITFVFLLISAAVPMNDQKQYYTSWANNGSITTGATSLQLAQVRVFPVALTFFLVPGIAFLGAGFIVAKDEMLF